MKNKGLIITLAVFLFIIVLSIISFMIFAINGNFKIPTFTFAFSTKESNKLVIDKTYDNNFDRLEIYTSASNIYIKESEDSSVHVVGYGENKIKINVEDNELILKSNEKKCVGLCFNRKISKINIYLPKDYDEKIFIENNYGDIRIDSFSKADINIDEDCGDVSILKGNNIDVDNNYGDIKISNANNVKIKESAGDVNIGNVNNIDVENNYGDIKIDKISNCLEIEDDCGDIKINKINLNKNSSIKNNYGDIKIGSTNQIYIDAESKLGDVKINNKYRKANIKLKIKNDCGDITINN